MQHKTYTHLPLLRPKQLFRLFDHLKVPSQVVAKYTGCTRQSVHLWRTKGQEDMRQTFIEKMNEVAYRLLRAAKAGLVPVTVQRRPSLAEWDLALADESYPKTIGEMSAQDLLPPALLAKFNPKPDSPDVAS